MICPPRHIAFFSLIFSQGSLLDISDILANKSRLNNIGNQMQTWSSLAAECKPINLKSYGLQSCFKVFKLCVEKIIDESAQTIDSSWSKL